MLHRRRRARMGLGGTQSEMLPRRPEIPLPLVFFCRRCCCCLSLLHGGLSAHLGEGRRPSHRRDLLPPPLRRPRPPDEPRGVPPAHGQDAPDPGPPGPLGAPHRQRRAVLRSGRRRRGGNRRCPVPGPGEAKARGARWGEGRRGRGRRLLLPCREERQRRQRRRRRRERGKRKQQQLVHQRRRGRRDPRPVRLGRPGRRGSGGRRQRRR